MDDAHASNGHADGGSGSGTLAIDSALLSQGSHLAQYEDYRLTQGGGGQATFGLPHGGMPLALPLGEMHQHMGGDESGMGAMSTEDEEKDRKKKKRPRKVLSCTTCVRRKTKCDKKVPCNACLKRGHPDKCVVEGVNPEEVRQPFAQAEEVDVLSRRVKALEGFISLMVDLLPEETRHKLPPVPREPEGDSLFPTDSFGDLSIDPAIGQGDANGAPKKARRGRPPKDETHEEHEQDAVALLTQLSREGKS